MILFGCDDVGPAKYLVEIIGILQSDISCIASKLSLSVFETTQSKIINQFDTCSNVELVVSGTSLATVSTSIDKKLVCWAKEKNIPSVAVIEHWSWYRKRFVVNGDLMLPDYIIVNDEIALNDAIEDGLPAGRLRSLGNPYLEQLSNTRIDIEDCDKLKLQYRIPLDKRIVVFVSEELKSVFTESTDDYLGYDEFSVLKAIQSAVALGDYLVIKKHPEEDPGKYSEFLCESVTIVDEITVTELAIISDIVIGMASMLLLELAVYRNDIISFRPNARKSFIGERLGVTANVDSVKDLAEVMMNGCEAKSSFADRFSGSRDRIVKFLGDIK